MDDALVLSDLRATVLLPTTEERAVCEMCESGASAQEYDQRLSELIAEHRFVVQAVQSSRCRPEFSYTIGLTAHGLPELVITAVRVEPAARLLRLWGDYMLDTSLLLPGERLECGPWLLEGVQVDRPQDHLLLAERRYGSAVRGLQLAWADERGRWPWEPGHRARRAGQPLLGAPAPQYCDEHQPDRLDVLPGLL